MNKVYRMAVNKTAVMTGYVYVIADAESEAKRLAEEADPESKIFETEEVEVVVDEGPFEARYIGESDTEGFNVVFEEEGRLYKATDGGLGELYNIVLVGFDDVKGKRWEYGKEVS